MNSEELGSKPKGTTGGFFRIDFIKGLNPFQIAHRQGTFWLIKPTVIS